MAQKHSGAGRLQQAPDIRHAPKPRAVANYGHKRQNRHQERVDELEQRDLGDRGALVAGVLEIQREVTDEVDEQDAQRREHQGQHCLDNSPLETVYRVKVQLHTGFSWSFEPAVSNTLSFHDKPHIQYACEGLGDGGVKLGRSVSWMYDSSSLY